MIGIVCIIVAILLGVKYRQRRHIHLEFPIEPLVFELESSDSDEDEIHVYSAETSAAMMIPQTGSVGSNVRKLDEEYDSDDESTNKPLLMASAV